MKKNYHYNNQGNQRRGYNNNRNVPLKNNQINNNNYMKAKEENQKLKNELSRKVNELNNYKKRIEEKRNELILLKGQKNPQNNMNYRQTKTISNNRGKSNNYTNRAPYNNSLDPFDDIFNGGNMNNLLFDDPFSLLPMRNMNRINPNFNPGDYEDYYENGNNNIINNFLNPYNNEESKIEQDIIDQLYPNPDRMTYEQLLELEENVGSVSKGLTKNQISRIPKVIYNKNRFGKDDNKCVVCQYEFKNGEEVTKLSCGHLFHSECVDTWLSKNKVCPMCHKEIVVK